MLCYGVGVSGPAVVKQVCAIICSVVSAMTACQSFKILRYWDILYRWENVIQVRHPLTSSTGERMLYRWDIHYRWENVIQVRETLLLFDDYRHTCTAVLTSILKVSLDEPAFFHCTVYYRLYTILLSSPTVPFMPSSPKWPIMCRVGR